MRHYVGNANTIYPQLFEDLMVDGMPVAPRGKPVREFLHVVTELLDPRQRVLTGYGRRANPFFQAAETVWILSGRADAEWICHFNSQLQQFLDPGRRYFHGAYGERLRSFGRSKAFGISAGTVVDQLGMVLGELRKDPESRRAVILFGNPAVDFSETNDRPCNIAFALKLRQGRLYWSTFNRSNDLLLGWAFTNIAQFTTVQEVVAAALGVEVGSYLHWSDSMHVYEQHPLTQRLVRPVRAFQVYEYLDPMPMARLNSVVEITGALNHPLAVRQELGDAYWQPVACPYWNAVARMIRGWDLLQAAPEGAAGDVADHVRVVLSGMAALDWRAAAYEYLVRWARRRVSSLAEWMAFTQGVRQDWAVHPEPVVEWLFHDVQGAD